MLSWWVPVLPAAVHEPPCCTQCGGCLLCMTCCALLCIDVEGKVHAASTPLVDWSGAHSHLVCHRTLPSQVLTFVMLFVLSFSGFLVSDVPVYFR